MEDLEKECWGQIKKLNWWNDPNDDRVASELERYFTLNEMIRLRDFVDNKQRELMDKFNEDWLDNPGIGVSDDGWSDLTAEVIGRGEEFYNNITAEQLAEMADCNDYQESFLYCFHITYDLERELKEKAYSEVFKVDKLN